MSLRTRLLGFFALLAVLPLLGMGVLHYVQSMRTVERHIAGQAELIAERAADQLVRRHDLHLSDLLLLAENAETQRLFRLLDGADAPDLDDATSSAREFVGLLWNQMSPYYHAAELRGPAGETVLRLGDRGVDAWLGPAALGGIGIGATHVLEEPIVDETTGEPRGTVVAALRVSHLLPTDALESRFGTAGYAIVLDRTTGGIVHHSRGAGLPWGGVPDATTLGFDPMETVFAAPSGRLRFAYRDSTRVAAFVNLDSPPWTVVSVSTLDEFAAPFERMRALNLMVVLLVIVAVAASSVLLVRRATRSLEELTAAAGDVSRGEFLPSLPPAGSDEVGRLAGAFATMVDRIREMVAQLQASRQMAAVGEFASEVAHEIRNPLTSVKLNLQRIDRAVSAGGGPAEAAAPLRIALREVARLERVVRGVLHLGRPRPLERGLVHVRTLTADATEAIRPETEARGVAIETSFHDGPDRVLGDADQLRGALINLLLNGVEAMPDGGTLRVSVARTDPTAADTLEVTIRDTGPGIPDAIREKLFRPFFTTKTDGTGLGLALALRTVEEHGGRLELLPSDPAGGAVFRISLPLVAHPAGELAAHAGGVGP